MVAFTLVVLRLCPIIVVTQVINILIEILTDAQVWAGSAKGPHDQRQGGLSAAAGGQGHRGPSGSQ